MKRWLIVIAIFLPAGVVAHVALVSVCAYRNGLYSEEWHRVAAPKTTGSGWSDDRMSGKAAGCPVSFAAGAWAEP